MTATALLIRNLVDGRLVGAAVVAPSARYASVLRAGIARPDRRFVHARDWLTVERELRELDSGPVDADSVLSRALLGERQTHSLVVQRLHETPIEAGPAAVAAALEALLASLAVPRLGLTQE